MVWLALPPYLGWSQFFLFDHGIKRLHKGFFITQQATVEPRSGVFHVADVGLPAADDKKVVPLNAAKELLRIALNPPQDDMVFLFLEKKISKVLVSLMLRPVVCPAVEGYIREKSMEVRFFAPGGCVANLDFVESIFGNGGDPFLAENDAGLDIEHWTGHTGCVIVAPHLAGTPKQILNLPSKTNATEREIRDGMYYEHPDDLYNDGGAFKLTLGMHPVLL